MLARILQSIHYKKEKKKNNNTPSQSQCNILPVLGGTSKSHLQHYCVVCIGLFVSNRKPCTDSQDSSI